MNESAQPATRGDVILDVTGLSRSFGQLRAVDGVSFRVAAGEILGIIGPNGSGKSTLLALLAGRMRPDSGRVVFRGNRIDRLGPSKRAELGLIQAAQVTQPFANLSLLDNVVVGATYGSRSARHSLGDAYPEAAQILRRVGIADGHGRFPRELPVAHVKLLEFARILASRPAVALLDEVLAGVEHRVGEQLVSLVQQLRGDGLTAVLVEHRVDLLFRLADRVIVLSQGRLIAEGDPEAIMKDSRVIEAYFGSRYAARLHRMKDPHSREQ